MQALIAYLSLLIPGLLGIGIVLFIHELGHFIAAKILKVDVDVLSFGFGPKLISFTGRNTEFRISAIPFGGYCRMKGSLDLTKALSDKKERISITEKGSYFSSRGLIRFIIYLSGPLTNFLLTVLLIAISSMIPVERLSDPAYISPISEYKSVFNSDIEQTGIKKGDLVLSSNGINFKDYQEFEDFIIENNGDYIDIEVLRDGNIQNVTLVPHKNGESYSYGITLLQKPIIGRTESPLFSIGDIVIAANGIPIESTLDLYALDQSDLTLTIDRNGEIFEYQVEDGVLPFAWKSDLRTYRDNINYLTYGFSEAFDMLKTTLKALGAVLSFDLNSAKNVITGPMKAATTFGEISTLAFQTSSQSGIRSTLYLLSIVSISLCIGNLLPIPTFDGGQMVITIAEMIKRDVLKPKTYLTLQILGMVAGYLIIAGMYLIDIINLI